MARWLCRPGSAIRASRDWPSRRTVFPVFRGCRLVSTCPEPRLVECGDVASGGLAQGLEEHRRMGQPGRSLLLCPEPVSVPQDTLPRRDPTTVEASLREKIARRVSCSPAQI